jgi:hypothetical protein
MGWVVNAMLQTFTFNKEPVPTVQEDRRVLGSVWTGVVNVAPTGIRYVSISNPGGGKINHIGPEQEGRSITKHKASFRFVGISQERLDQHYEMCNGEVQKSPKSRLHCSSHL